MIDNMAYGMCKCGEERDFRKLQDKQFPIGKTRKGIERDLCSRGQYYMQGTIRGALPYRSIDYCFSVDNTL